MITSSGFAVPRYGEASLSDVMPSVLAALEVGGDNRLDLAPSQRAVVMLVDGMGLVGLREHADAAPYLSSMTCRELTAGFPSTTVTSLASLSTGVPAGQHALTGYTSYVTDVDGPVNWLAWKEVGKGDDLRDQLVPEVVQPEPTTWQRAADAGVAVSIVSAHQYEGTGLTRAVFRGGGYTGTTTAGDAVALAGDMADRGHQSLVYAYISELDLIGHVRGPGTDAWIAQLELVDRHVSALAERLPAGTALYVTADHGMTALDQEAAIDADVPGSPLREGVRAIAGEPRMRHVHAQPGAAADVLAAWRSVIGDRAWVISGDEAVATGLFGPVVTPMARERIGDVLAIAKDGFGVVQRRRESLASALAGHHGSLTDAELLVPLLSVQL
ncbi:MAG: alkaline phosphatase family protein [Frankiaceae bacterium]|nr:alkaline phosphatase family protein [Frankiaceae bacterium]MBV9870248.1 alkaline phosphatase family protein [Frankiaceae bacterium]